MDNARKFPFSGFFLKLFAIVFMTLDHIGAFLILNGMGGDAGFVLRGIGRLALPLFLFLLVEGIRHTKHPREYLERIALMYLLLSGFSALAVYAFKQPLPANIFPDLLYIASFFLFLRLNGAKALLALLPLGLILGGYACDAFETFSGQTVMWFPYFLRPSYGILSFLIALAFYFAPKLLAKTLKTKESEEGFRLYLESFDGRKSLNVIGNVLFAIAVVLFWGFTYLTPGRELSGPMDMSFQTYCLLAIPFLFLYNGERGYDSKPWRAFNYLYYPAHLAILFLVFYFIA